MSGFERSAPIPGSQGPRRSQMHRINNAPPPLTPWRQEVLDAQRQAAHAVAAADGRSKAAPKTKDRSRSRSRSRRRRDDRDRDRDKGGGAKKKDKTDPDAVPVVKDTLLRQAREFGEGWTAAIAKASKAWEPDLPTQGDSSQKATNEASSLSKSGKEKDDRRRREKDKEKDKADRHDTGEPSHRSEDDRIRQRRKDEEDLTVRREREDLERKWRAEYEAREKKLAEDKRKAEEHKKRKQEEEQKRKAKLGNAFAMSDDDEDDDRAAAMLRKAAERKRKELLEASTTAGQQEEAQQGFSSLTGGMADLKAELSKQFGLQGGSDSAEAFMRLQERKRKGRRAEFGGPPRGCSPWRDGKRPSKDK
eukprot:TRINITY_DN10702_c0_g1_i2.p1 TRINITY_DN10702_c0_g1~~TRINITY_DN10702_c0_g1_i2.p1  ORF type:complete len:362 (-),score=125.76 TRINITY_DN10702_c0_g1_i2:82-1167(-)